MRYLIDTQILMWSVYKPSRLSTQAVEVMTNTSNSLFFSHASLWELQIKEITGKLGIDERVETMLARETQANGMQLLSIEPRHIYYLAQLPYHKNHADPFDRMLIAQAAVENLVLLTDDEKIHTYNYGITTLR